MTQKMKIMAAVDLSDYSATIVRYSVWLTMRLDADLVLVNVINQRDLDLVQRTMTGYEAFSYPNYLTEQVQGSRNQDESDHPGGLSGHGRLQLSGPDRHSLPGTAHGDRKREARPDGGGHQGPQQPGRRGGRFNGSKIVPPLAHTTADDTGGF